MHQHTIKIFVHIPGDMSVGIRPVVYCAECDKASLYTYDSRETTREVFRQAYASLEEDNPRVWIQFEDECPDCLRVGCMGECVASESFSDTVDGRR